MSCFWIKLTIIGYLTAPAILLIAAALPLPEHMFQRHLSVANLVLYLLAAFQLVLIAFLPHQLVFAAQNKLQASEAASHTPGDTDS